MEGERERERGREGEGLQGPWGLGFRVGGLLRYSLQLER